MSDRYKGWQLEHAQRTIDALRHDYEQSRVDLADMCNQRDYYRRRIVDERRQRDQAVIDLNKAKARIAELERG